MTVTEPIRHSSTRTRVLAVHDGVRSERTDSLATEEPLEIRVQGPEQEPVQVAVTMRTPGGDFELAVGFLFTEGLIAPGDVQRVAYCDDLPGEDQRYNVVSVTLARPFDAERLRRNFYATSSCGVCGKAALEDIEVRCAPVAPRARGRPRAPDLAARARSARRRRVFERTGGLHAAGLFDAAGTAARGARGRRAPQRGRQGGGGAVPRGPRPGGRDDPAGERPGVVRDRPEGGGGRHPDRQRGERTVSLAVEAAERLGMTLVGFVRDGRVQRLHATPSASPRSRADSPEPRHRIGRRPAKGARLDEERAHAAHRADGPRQRRAAHGDLGRGPRPGRRRVARRPTERNGGDGVGMFSCSKATNEMNFVAQKFTRQVLGSNNIDSCNRT